MKRLVLLALVLLAWALPVHAQTVTLDDFESGLRIVCNACSPDYTKYLWVQYPSDFTNAPPLGATDPGTFDGVHRRSGKLPLPLSEGSGRATFTGHVQLKGHVTIQ